MKSGSANRRGSAWSSILLGSSLLLSLGWASGCNEAVKCDGSSAQSVECGALSKGSPRTADQGSTPAATPEECAQRDPADCGLGCMSATGTRYDLARACTYPSAPAGCFAPQLANVPGVAEPQVVCDGGMRLLTSPEGQNFLFHNGCAPMWPTTLVDNAMVMQIVASNARCTP